MAEVRAAHGNTRERDVMQRAAHYNTVYARRGGMRRLSRSLARLGKSSRGCPLESTRLVLALASAR